MPREQINHPDLTVWPTDPDEPHRERAVHVSWARSCGYVQIALEADPADFVGDGYEGVVRTAKYSPGLTLGEVDRMIATLRRARAQAFYTDA